MAEIRLENLTKTFGDLVAGEFPVAGDRLGAGPAGHEQPCGANDGRAGHDHFTHVAQSWSRLTDQDGVRR